MRKGVGFAPAERFDKEDAVFQIMPGTKTVIGLAFRVLRGIYRGIEEGSTYYQYTTMAVENMEEIIMPMAQLKVEMMLEQEGYMALPQRRHQQIMAEENSTNPEVAYDAICRSRTAEVQINFLDAAIKYGLGEKGSQVRQRLPLRRQKRHWTRSISIRLHSTHTSVPSAHVPVIWHVMCIWRRRVCWVLRNKKTWK